MAAANLDLLRTFVTVARAGSLTQAARLLGISQPTVSAHIQALEAQLGYPCLIRSRDGVTTTPKGAALARDVAPHVDALDDALGAGSAWDGPSPAVHVGGPAELLSTRVVPRLPELLTGSRATVHLRFGLADDLLRALIARELDITVSAVRPSARGLSATPLMDEEFALVAAPRWAGSELDAIPLLAYAEHLPIVRRYWRSVFDRPPVGLELVAVVPDLRGIADALVTGVGMSVLPEYLIADRLANGQLVRLVEPPVPPLNTVYLVTRGREAQGDGAVALVAGGLRAMLG